MSLDQIKPMAWIVLGLFLGWLLFAGDGTPVIVNIETNEIAKERWMLERKQLHSDLFKCEHKDNPILKE